MRNKSLLLPLVLFALMVGVRPVQAVIVSTTDGTGYTDSGGFAYWDNIARLGGGTGIYMGDRWVLTAAHVGANPITLKGTTYNPVAGTTIQLTNSDSTLTDLVIFRINGDPGLPTVPIATAAPAKDNMISMYGSGYNRQPALLKWDYSWQPYKGKFNPPYSGYAWDTTSYTLRAGSNMISTFSPSPSDVTRVFSNPNNSTWSTTCFNAIFDQYSGPSEAIAAPGDSGGPVFYDDGTTVQLAGLMLYISSPYQKPANVANTAVFGDTTLMADLYSYRSQLHPLNGDANLDGRVDQSDYKIWYDNYGKGSSWATGDFNSDGVVDQNDYKVWYDNYGAGTDAPPLTGAGQLVMPVPEPATVLLVLPLALAAIRHRQSKKANANSVAAA